MTDTDPMGLAQVIVKEIGVALGDLVLIIAVPIVPEVTYEIVIPVARHRIAVLDDSMMKVHGDLATLVQIEIDLGWGIRAKVIADVLRLGWDALL